VTRARDCVRGTTRDDVKRHCQRWGEETGPSKGRKVGSEIWVKGQGTGMKGGARALGYQKIRFDTHIEETRKR